MVSELGGLVQNFAQKANCSVRMVVRDSSNRGYVRLYMCSKAPRVKGLGTKCNKQSTVQLLGLWRSPFPVAHSFHCHVEGVRKTRIDKLSQGGPRTDSDTRNDVDSD